MPSCEKAKEAIPWILKKSSPQLGIIRHTAKYPLCRARHNGYFDVAMLGGALGFVLGRFLSTAERT